MEFVRDRICKNVDFHIFLLSLFTVLYYFAHSFSLIPEKPSLFSKKYHKVADLSPIHFRKQSATDGNYGSKYWGFTRGLAAWIFRAKSTTPGWSSPPISMCDSLGNGFNFGCPVATRWLDGRQRWDVLSVVF